MIAALQQNPSSDNLRPKARLLPLQGVQQDVAMPICGASVLQVCVIHPKGHSWGGPTGASQATLSIDHVALAAGIFKPASKTSTGRQFRDVLAGQRGIQNWRWTDGCHHRSGHREGHFSTTNTQPWARMLEPTRGGRRTVCTRKYLNLPICHTLIRTFKIGRVEEEMLMC